MPLRELPVGTLTVLHTEIEDSTSLTVRLGDRYPEILAESALGDPRKIPTPTRQRFCEGA